MAFSRPSRAAGREGPAPAESGIARPEGLRDRTPPAIETHT